MPPRILMLGTGDFALPTFRHLLDEGRDVVGLVTQPDRPQGRKQELIPSRIKQAAIDRGVAVFQPEDVNTSESIAEIARTFAPDLLVTAAYGQILSADLLASAPLGGINLHGSILPSYRGAAPVARAIQDGRAETGVTVIRMTPKIDAGGMIAVARTPIGHDETAGEVERRLSEIGAPLIAGAIDAIVEGRAVILPQERALVTRAPKLKKEDGLIDWSRPAQAVHDLIRAMQPWPRASTRWHPSGGSREPVRVIVLGTAVEGGPGEPGRAIVAGDGSLVIAAGSGSVRLLSIQPEGKKPMAASEFLRGHPVAIGDRFGP